MWKILKRLKLWQQIFIGMSLGVAVGLLLGEQAAYLKPLGVVFLNLIKMVIVPLILFSLISALVSMDDITKAGSMGIKSFAIYIATTAFAISIGLLAASFIDIGTGVDISQGGEISRTVQDPFSFADTITGLVPENPIKAMADGNVLQIIIFAILVGIAINVAGKKGEAVAAFINSANEVTHSLTLIVMKFAPFGVFALMAWLSGTQDAELLRALLWLIVVVYLVCAVQIFVVYGFLLRFFANISPFVFFKKIIPAQLMAYSSSSSAATLPVTMQVAVDDMGISPQTASFTLPLGTTVNMDGTALYQGVSALFVAQALGVDLVFSDYVTIILTATLASIGSAGIPGAGLIMLTLVLTSVGLPIEGIAVIAGIDRILDMARTVVNVSGDATVALLVDSSEKRFNKQAYLA